MTKIYCADLRCKYRNGKGYCTLKEINLSQNSIITKWEGRKEFNTCNNMEESDEYREMRSVFMNAMKENK